MLKAHFQMGRLALILAVLLLSSGGVKATTISLGPNVGTFSYTVISNLYDCTDVYTYTEYDFSNMVYTSVDGVQHSLGSDSTYSTHSTNSVCKSSVGPTITYNGTGYTLVIRPTTAGSLNVTVTVPGYVNPKYMVVGIIYAPPGSSSYTDYSTSNLVSSTVTTKSTFSTGYTQTNTVEFSRSIKPWKNGQIDASSKDSTSYTNTTTTTDSTAVTIQQVTGISSRYYGPVCDYCGVDHDYDQIGVWLNPVMLYTLTNNGVVQSNGYGYSTWDQPGVDVYWVYAGELNGDFQMRQSTTQVFARSWATAPFGQGQALTAQDMQNILQMDPYWNCTYKSPVSDTTNCARPADPNRYTQSTNQNFPYVQPVPGIPPDTKGYTWSYTNTNNVGLTYTKEIDQTFSYESTFGFSIFGIGFKDTVSQSTTIKHIYETSSDFTSSSTSTATASITGPACHVVNGSCSPVYPPSNAYSPIPCTPLSLPTAFGQGTSMYIYQDNLFGSFLFEPYGQP